MTKAWLKKTFKRRFVFYDILDEPKLVSSNAYGALRYVLRLRNLDLS